MPEISVVMPVYNCEQYVGKAVESILKQSFKDFELIVIDDGSTDNTLDAILEVVKSDRRLRLIQTDNRGIVDSLNTGVSIANGNFIARMDGDDISRSNRFQVQLDEMKRNPNVR